MGLEVKKLSEVKINMVYGVPLQKQKKKITRGLEFVTSFLEPCLPYSPLVADLNLFHMHSNISYGDLFGRGVVVRGWGLGQAWVVWLIICVVGNHKLIFDEGLSIFLISIGLRNINLLSNILASIKFLCCKTTE